MKNNTYSFNNIFNNTKDNMPTNHKKINYLIHQIQNEYENDEDVYNLLIASIKLAQILNLKDIEHWLKLELKGYKNNNDLPNYRKISPEIKILNPYMGWEPLYIYDQNFADSLEFFSINLSLPTILNLLKHNNETIKFYFGNEIEKTLMDFINYDFSDFKINCVIDSSDFVNIINLTKNTILDFAKEIQIRGLDSIELSKNELVINKKLNQNFNNNGYPKYKIMEKTVEKNE